MRYTVVVVIQLVESYPYLSLVLIESLQLVTPSQVLEGLFVDC